MDTVQAQGTMRTATGGYYPAPAPHSSAARQANINNTNTANATRVIGNDSTNVGGVGGGYPTTPTTDARAPTGRPRSNTLNSNSNAAASLAAPAPAAAAPDTSSTNLMVRQLSLTVTEATLRSVFAAFGKIVSHTVMRNIHTGESLGKAFVRFETHEEASACFAFFTEWTKAAAAVAEQRRRARTATPPAQSCKEDGSTNTTANTNGSVEDTPTAIRAPLRLRGDPAIDAALAALPANAAAAAVLDTATTTTTANSKNKRDGGSDGSPSAGFRESDFKAASVQWARKQHDKTPDPSLRRFIMKLFVRNVPVTLSKESLAAFFGNFGPVVSVTMHKDTAAAAATTPVVDPNANTATAATATTTPAALVVDLPSTERRIAFVIYEEEGAADRAATAVHNTKPFPECGEIPIMVKLAEDYSTTAKGGGNVMGVRTTTTTNNAGGGNSNAHHHIQQQQQQMQQMQHNSHGNSSQYQSHNSGGRHYSSSYCSINNSSTCAINDANGAALETLSNPVQQHQQQQQQYHTTTTTTTTTNSSGPHDRLEGSANLGYSARVIPTTTQGNGSGGGYKKRGGSNPDTPVYDTYFSQPLAAPTPTTAMARPTAASSNFAGSSSSGRRPSSVPVPAGDQYITNRSQQQQQQQQYQQQQYEQQRQHRQYGHRNGNGLDSSMTPVPYCGQPATGGGGAYAAPQRFRGSVTPPLPTTAAAASTTTTTATNTATNGSGRGSAAAAVVSARSRRLSIAVPNHQQQQQQQQQQPDAAAHYSSSNNGFGGVMLPPPGGNSGRRGGANSSSSSSHNVHGNSNIVLSAAGSNPPSCCYSGRSVTTPTATVTRSCYHHNPYSLTSSRTYITSPVVSLDRSRVD